MEKAHGLKRRLLIFFLVGGFSVILSTQAFGQVKKNISKKAIGIIRQSSVADSGRTDIGELASQRDEN
jgi:hypothetical protein